MKKKIKDLTLEEIIKISKKYKNKCSECPLYSIKEIPCMTFCELSRNKQSLIEKELDQEIEVKTMDIINKTKKAIDIEGYDYFCYLASGYVAECIEIKKAQDIYIACIYTSAESNDGDLEEVFRSKDFNEVIKCLYEEGYFNEESCDISKEEVEEYLKG